MDRSLLPDIAFNGGFPEPLASEPVRVIAARHAACGEATRVRLPEAVPARAVRRVRCAGCKQEFETERVEEIEFEDLVAAAVAAPEPVTVTIEPESIPELDPVGSAEQVYVFGTGPRPEPATAPRGPRRPNLPKLSLPSISLPRPKLPQISGLPSLPKFDPESRSWRLASIGIAGAAVLGGLLLIQSGDESTTPAPPAIEAATVEAEGAAGSDAATTPPASISNPSKDTELVRGSSYSLALPAGWEQVDPSGGATFAAVAPDGGADATLWIDEDPKLDFPNFVNQSLAQLEAFAGSAQIVERVPAPSPEATIVRLAADAPPGQPSYEVTLRVAGAYRYYLATSVQPDAPAETVAGAELVAGSFTPEVKG